MHLGLAVASWQGLACPQSQNNTKQIQNQVIM